MEIENLKGFFDKMKTDELFFKQCREARDMDELYALALPLIDGMDEESFSRYISMIDGELDEIDIAQVSGGVSYIFSNRR